MITCVLGAPASGKSTVAPALAELLPGHAVLDWDALMLPAGALAGREIRRNPETWPAYRELIHAIVVAVAHLPVVLLGVCTPAELDSWPIETWVLLDCADDERRRRLARAAAPEQVEDAIRDGHEYHLLGLPVIDTTGLEPQAVADDLAQFIQSLESPDGTAIRWPERAEQGYVACRCGRWDERGMLSLPAVMAWLDDRAASPRRHGRQISISGSHQEPADCHGQVKNAVFFPVRTISDDLRRIGDPTSGGLSDLREHCEAFVDLDLGHLEYGCEHPAGMHRDVRREPQCELGRIVDNTQAVSAWIARGQWR